MRTIVSIRSPSMGSFRRTISTCLSTVRVETSGEGLGFVIADHEIAMRVDVARAEQHDAVPQLGRAPALAGPVP